MKLGEVFPRFPGDPTSRLIASPLCDNGSASVETLWLAVAKDEACGGDGKKITGFFQVVETGTWPVPATTSSANKHLREGDFLSHSTFSEMFMSLLSLDFSTWRSAVESTSLWNSHMLSWLAESREELSDGRQRQVNGMVQQLTVDVTADCLVSVVVAAMQSLSTTESKDNNVTNDVTPTVPTLNGVDTRMICEYAPPPEKMLKPTNMLMTNEPALVQDVKSSTAATMTTTASTATIESDTKKRKELGTDGQVQGESGPRLTKKLKYTEPHGNSISIDHAMLTCNDNLTSGVTPQDQEGSHSRHRVATASTNGLICIPLNSNLPKNNVPDIKLQSKVSLSTITPQSVLEGSQTLQASLHSGVTNVANKWSCTPIKRHEGMKIPPSFTSQSGPESPQHIQAASSNGTTICTNRWTYTPINNRPQHFPFYEDIQGGATAPANLAPQASGRAQMTYMGQGGNIGTVMSPTPDQLLATLGNNPYGRRRQIAQQNTTQSATTKQPYTTQFSGFGYNLIHNVPPVASGEGEAWVEYMTKHDSYDPILKRLAVIMNHVPSYCHHSYLPFATPNQVYRRSQAVQGWGIHAPVFSPSVDAKTFSNKCAAAVAREFVCRRKMYRRIDDALKHLSTLKKNGAKAIELITTLEELSNRELSRTGLYFTNRDRHEA
ncbi:hypothetical protein BGZ94_010451 [Podila epigama]|nr:hypothetical protein BGZ94_010451 [Podila epigama]